MRPFHIRVEEEVLDDLEIRLGRARWTRASDEPGWLRGTDPMYLRALVNYWRVGFDWRRQEALLGELPQYIARLDGADIHYVHLRAAHPRGAVLLLHGWPDSFYRYHRVAPLLVAAGYDVVVPSLPGFGFSPALAITDQPLRDAATLMYSLMTSVLGYSLFGVVGGDLGGIVAQLLALDFPASITGIHLTDVGRHVIAPRDGLRWRERRYISRAGGEDAITLVQETSPRSIAVSLTDSPIGLASWILDRFHAWSDGDVDVRFGKDTLLTNIMLYWVTASIGSAIATFRAEAAAPSLAPDEYVFRPVALALFPDDIGGIPPRRFAERTLDVTRWTEMPRGGRFGALEEPELYAADAADFFRSLEAA